MVQKNTVANSTAQHSTAQHSTAQSNYARLYPLADTVLDRKIFLLIDAKISEITLVLAFLCAKMHSILFFS